MFFKIEILISRKKNKNAIGNESLILGMVFLRNFLHEIREKILSLWLVEFASMIRRVKDKAKKVLPSSILSNKPKIWGRKKYYY